jgi:hypothetical protein
MDNFVRKFFDDKNIVMWGRSFDIVNHTTRDEAEEFLQSLLLELGFVEIIADPEIRSSSIEYN